MKKLLFMFATAALVLSACSSEDDIVQGGGSLSQLGASGALGFDVYTASATKAGDPTGVMNTEKLKTENKGFGVFAMYQNGTNYPANNTTLLPNFMFNEHVSWTAAGGWSYSPLKYWPNETIQDSQDPAAVMPGIATPGTNIDKLSFFAYAPYVVTGAAPLATKDDVTMVINRGAATTISAYHGSETSGITAISAQDYASDPKVAWAYSTDLDQNVDLLWGVAPNGMAYQSVNPDIYINKEFGKPLLDLVKPDKDQKIKFLFNHALSRIGLSVVSAVDQIAAGGDGGKFNNLQTRVLIKSVEVYGGFGKQGVLNLNNTEANKANWIEASIEKAADDDLLFTFDNGEGGSPNGYIAPDLRYVTTQIDAVTGAVDKATAATNFAALNTGVLPSEQTLLAGGVDPSKEATDLTYEVGKKLYKLSGTDYVRATTTATAAADVFKKVNSNWTQVAKSTDPAITLNGDEEQYYTLAETSKTGDEVAAASGSTFFIKTTDGTSGLVTYTKHVSNGSESSTDGNTYVSLAATTLAVNDYTGTCYTDLTPRYFMVIPTGNTNIKVKITYAVVTYDEKLGGYSTNVENAITKATSLTLESGKSYNLKLILGLTSVKLDATVADWQVDGSNEVYLPQNNE